MQINKSMWSVLLPDVATIMLQNSEVWDFETLKLWEVMEYIVVTFNNRAKEEDKISMYVITEKKKYFYIAEGRKVVVRSDDSGGHSTHCLSAMYLKACDLGALKSTATWHYLPRAPSNYQRAFISVNTWVIGDIWHLLDTSGRLPSSTLGKQGGSRWEGELAVNDSTAWKISSPSTKMNKCCMTCRHMKTLQHTVRCPPHMPSPPYCLCLRAGMLLCFSLAHVTTKMNEMSS